MAIIRWDPWSLSPRWGFRFPRLWDLDEDWFDASEGCSIYETGDSVVVEAAVPGIPTEKIDVSINKGMITIKAEYKEEEEKKKKKKTVYRGSHEANFFYQANLPADVRTDRAKAEIKDGVVVVTLPKSEGAKPKTLKVTEKKEE
jgi:HSP20 family protein